MSDILVSSFKNAKDVHPVNATLESILDAIRSTRLQAQIGRLRHTLQTAGKAAYNAQKIALPAVTFGGTFTRRAADCLHAASGYMICDVDGVLDAQGVKELVAGDEHVKAAFISPSGVGVKFLVAVPAVADATAFSRMFPVVSNYFLEVYNVILDRQGSDISRLCFLSHDPAMIINDDHNIIPFEVDLTSDTADAMPSDVPRMDHENCDFSGRVQTDGDQSVEFTASLHYTDAEGERRTLIAYYYQMQSDLDNVGELDQLDWEIEGYEVY